MPDALLTSHSASQYRTRSRRSTQMKWIAVLIPLFLHAQTAPPPGRPTDHPAAAEIAKLKSGPALPYKVVPTWPTVPKGMNFGEVSGVDLDRQGNVWVFNRG